MRHIWLSLTIGPSVLSASPNPPSTPSMDPVLDDTAPATAETIIHALSQFHTPIEHVSERERDASAEGLESFSRRQLEEEVLRLRGVVQEQPGSHPDASLRASSIQEASSTRSIRPGQPVVPRSSLQADTGKRVEKNRRTELFRAIRCCVSRFSFRGCFEGQALMQIVDAKHHGHG